METCSEEITPRYLGRLKGHRDWVTCLRTPFVESDPCGYHLVSGSRDKKLMIWRLSPEDEYSAGYALKALSGHSQAVQDLSLSTNNKFAITASWDSTLRLWELETSTTLRTFKGHTSDVNTVALSPDNRQIVSGSRDQTIKLWNTLAECKYCIDDEKHKDWVSCVQFSPSRNVTLVVSCGWDKVVKVWDLNGCDLKTNLIGHTGPIYSVTISPDGSLCASGGKDGVAMLWDVNDGKHLFSLPAHSTINSLCFSPCHYWLCGATDESVKIWSLEDDKNVIAELKDPTPSGQVAEGGKSKKSGIPWCVSLAWSADGHILYVGSTNGYIYVYEFSGE